MRKAALILSILALCCLTACKHKELCYDHAHTVKLNVVFDWRNAPDASPATMSLYLFPVDGGNALRYEFTNSSGGVVTVPFGTYEALCLNSDGPAILYRGIDRPETFELYTREADLLSQSIGISSTKVPRAADTDDQRVVLPPDMVWSDRMGGTIVLGVEDTEKTVTFYPDESVYTYTVEVINAENLEYVLGVSGSLSGMSGGLMAGTNHPTDEQCIIPFDAVSDGVSTVTGELMAFGHCAPDNMHQLTIYAVLADNSKWYQTFDVAGQVHASADRHIHILIDGLSLPKPITDGSGYHPEVDEWGEVKIDITM